MSSSSGSGCSGSSALKVSSTVTCCPAVGLATKVSQRPGPAQHSSPNQRTPRRPRPRAVGSRRCTTRRTPRAGSPRCGQVHRNGDVMAVMSCRLAVTPSVGSIAAGSSCWRCGAASSGRIILLQAFGMRWWTLNELRSGARRIELFFDLVESVAVPRSVEAGAKDGSASLRAIQACGVDRRYVRATRTRSDDSRPEFEGSGVTYSNWHWSTATLDRSPST